jgi:glycosyltransferase 2 family protein
VKRLAHIGLFLAGLGVAVWIVRAVGWPAVRANFAAIGWWFLGLVVLYGLAQLAFMSGWWIVIERRLRSAGFWRLFGVYLAGDSVNYLVPWGNLAGEPVKAGLLRETWGMSQALTSITVHKHAELLAQWAFMAGGTAVALFYFAVPALVTLAAVAVLIGLGGSLLCVTWFLRRGTYLPVLNRLAAWKPLAARLQRHRDAAEALDGRLRAFYRDEGPRFAASTGLCLLGWCGGLLETYIVLHLLSPGQGWVTALAIEALAMTLNNLFLFIPGRVGSAEGVRAGVFLLLGLPVAQGVAYGIVRRGRELIWFVPGLLVLLKQHAGWLGQVWRPTPLRGEPNREPAAAATFSGADRG